MKRNAFYLVLLIVAIAFQLPVGSPAIADITQDYYLQNVNLLDGGGIGPPYTGTVTGYFTLDYSTPGPSGPTSIAGYNLTVQDSGLSPQAFVFSPSTVNYLGYASTGGPSGSTDFYTMEWWTSQLPGFSTTELFLQVPVSLL